MNDENAYDVCIVGGGMIGAALGCALGDSGMRVAVLEARLPDELDADAPPELRVSAITRASQNLFAAVGAWSGMVARRVSPYRHMTVWDARGEGQIDFDAADVGEDELGYIIENRVVQLALLERLRDFDRVELMAPVSLRHIDWHDAGARVELDDGRILNTRLVVAADGARSRASAMPVDVVVLNAMVQAGSMARSAAMSLRATFISPTLTAWIHKSQARGRSEP